MVFKQARNYTSVSPRDPRRIDLIVIHTMESLEKPTTAEDVADWFAGISAPQASAHYCIDSNSIVQCVLDKDVAWHAPGANHNGLGFEHAGRAAQTSPDWSDPYSKAELELSAPLAAAKCQQYDIPVKHLTVAELRAGKRGLIGHVDATQAFPGPGRTHTDPGTNFPWTKYLGMINRHMPPASTWKPGDPLWQNLPGPRPKPEWVFPLVAEVDRRVRLLSRQ